MAKQYPVTRKMEIVEVSGQANVQLRVDLDRDWETKLRPQSPIGRDNRG